MHGLTATERVLAIEGVVEDDELSGRRRITFQMGEKKGEGVGTLSALATLADFVRTSVSSGADALDR